MQKSSAAANAPSPSIAGFAYCEPDQLHRLKPDSENAREEFQKSTDTPVEAIAPADSDLTCALRAREGDRSATEILVKRHHAAVARLLWRFVRTQTDLDDLVQETFLRMVRGLPGWRADQPFIHWLLRIATNTGRDYFRRQSVRRRWMVEPTGADDAPELEAVDPSTNVPARAAAHEVKTMLARLPPDDRALLTLHHLEGLPLAEIARQFNWTVTATKLRAWRARRRMRSFIEAKDLS